MNSLEALNRVKQAPSFMGGCSYYAECTQSAIPFTEDINCIKKDLKAFKNLIDILKKGDINFRLFQSNDKKRYYVEINYRELKLSINEITKNQFDLLKDY